LMSVFHTKGQLVQGHMVGAWLVCVNDE
jgi:hypothetical protein